MSQLQLDRAGRRRSPATMPGFHGGRPPRNKGLRYPADPPKVEEIIAVMRAAGNDAHGRRLRGLIVILWRAGLRIQEALALAEADLDQRRGALLVRRGKGGRRREVGMDRWGWDELQPWLELRLQLPVGPLLCVINGPTRGRHWSSAAARADLRRTAVQAGVRRRFAPHQLRHAHAVELAREGVPLIVIQRQLGHSNLGITSVYLQGIDNAEIIETVRARRQPMIPVCTSPRAETTWRNAARRAGRQCFEQLFGAAVTHESVCGGGGGLGGGSAQPVACALGMARGWMATGDGHGRGTRGSA
jgi:integrase